MVHYDKPLKRAIVHRMFIAALLLVAMAGCSRPRGTVSGQVTFQGQPMPAGSVTFVHADGTTMSGSIQGGNYSIAKVPTGACTVLVVSLPPPRSMWNPEKNEMVGSGAASDKLRRAMFISPRYGDPRQSDLHHEVMAGSQTYDIDLKP